MSNLKNPKIIESQYIGDFLRIKCPKDNGLKNVGLCVLCKYFKGHVSRALKPNDVRCIY